MLNDKMSCITSGISLHTDSPDKIRIDEVPPKSYLSSDNELRNEKFNESALNDEMIALISAVFVSSH